MDRGARLAAGVVGAGILGSVVHTSISSSGGYDTTTSPMTISLACGLAVGAAALGYCWRDRRYILTALIAVGLLAGEAVMLITTAERTLTQREMKQAPLNDKAKKRAEAKQKADEAEAAAAGMSQTERLRQAIEKQGMADKAIADNAATRSCLGHCKEMLLKQADAAKQEVDAARAEFAQLKADAERKAREARAYYDGLPVPPSASPLADRLGVAGWAIDVVTAALNSIAANGLGAFLLAFAGHGRRREPVRVIAASAVEVMTADTMEKALPKSEPRDVDEEANKFACLMFRPERGGTVTLDGILPAYRHWSTEEGREPLPDDQMGAALSRLFLSVGLKREGDAIHGIRWSDKVPAVIAA